MDGSHGVDYAAVGAPYRGPFRVESRSPPTKNLSLPHVETKTTSCQRLHPILADCLKESQKIFYLPLPRAMPLTRSSDPLVWIDCEVRHS